MTVRDCLEEYKTLGGEIFGRPRFFIQLNFGLGNRTKYDTRTFQKVLERVVSKRSHEMEAEGDTKTSFRSLRKDLCKT